MQSWEVASMTFIKMFRYIRMIFLYVLQVIMQAISQPAGSATHTLYRAQPADNDIYQTFGITINKIG